ncbi:hypothetical protein HGRIS_003090 [Hohenbuehelia grisea]|uniref:Fungal lipase-type domain-containing protein n=1 Tax=Hohenbuehelia grisea TaxID=104357 RepID=A0ABR3JMF1_9AGAR
MLPITLLLALACVLLGPLALAAPVEPRADGISQATYDNLVRYAKYSSAVYQLICIRPLGNTLIGTFDTTGTQGFVVRDDSRKEIVLAFRGSLEPIDILIDIQLLLTPLRSPGISNVGGAWVHTGFQKAYNFVDTQVHRMMATQLAANPSYSIVVTGHSLGGAVASFAALSLKQKYPSRGLKLYTYGAPRIGNAAWATLMEQQLKVDNIFRGVHTWDGVPTMIGRFLDYRHYGTEYWQHTEPSKPSNVRKCNGGEDTSCSNSIISTGINPPHLVQFGQLMALNPLLCLGP